MFYPKALIIANNLLPVDSSKFSFSLNFELKLITLTNSFKMDFPKWLTLNQTKLNTSEYIDFHFYLNNTNSSFNSILVNNSARIILADTNNIVFIQNFFLAFIS